MAWPNLPGVAKVVVTYGFDGEPSVNVHFVLKRNFATPISLLSLEQIGDEFFDALQAEWIPFMGDQWTIDDIVTTDWSVANGEQFQRVTGLPLVGTEVNEEVPASVCIVASHRTPFTGRSFRGRSYMPGLTEANVGGNGVDGALVSAVGDYFSALATGLGSISADLVVYSLFAAGAQRTVPVATVITSTIVNSRVDTQRRRLPD